MRKSDKAQIVAGQYSCIIDRWGCIVNPPAIDVWSEKNVREYMEFLQKLLDSCYYENKRKKIN